MGVQNLLRKAAIEKMASPEQLDTAMRVTSPMSWLALATIGALIGGAVVYSVVGRMTVRVDGQGITVRGRGTETVEVSANGTVKSILVKPGDLVEVGDVVAQLDLPELESEIRASEDRIADLERLQGDSSITRQNIRRGFLREIRALEQQLASKRRLLEQGLARRQDVARIQAQIEGKKREMFQAEQQEVGQSQQLDEERRRLQQLKEQWENNSVIRSRYRGKVAAVLTPEGQVIRAGERLINLEDPDAPLEILLFVPFSEGKKIDIGDPVRISPSTVKSEEYGFMLGEVTSVSSQPVTIEEVRNTLNNDALAQKFSSDTPFQVRVKPQVDEQGRFVWTSEGGPPSEVVSNTPVTAQIIVDKKAPYTYVIPTVKKALGAGG